jgi:hypothetical protein
MRPLSRLGLGRPAVAERLRRAMARPKESVADFFARPSSHGTSAAAARAQ